MQDLAHLTEAIFGERWSDFSQPPLASIGELRRAVENVARDHRARPIFKLDWLPDIVVTRRGKSQRANVIAWERVPDFEYFDPANEIWVQKWKEIEILLPRWGFRQLVPDGLARPSWEAERMEWVTETAGGVTADVLVDYLGDFPADGLYRDMPGAYGCIATHTANCCLDALTQQKTCFGRYREPDWEMVERLKDGWHKFLREPQLRMADDAATETEVRRYAQQRSDEQQAYRDKVAANVKEELRDLLVGMGRPQVAVPGDTSIKIKE